MRASEKSAVRCLRGKSQPIVDSHCGIWPPIMNMSEMKASGMTMPLLTASVSCIVGSAMASASPRALKLADAMSSVTTIAATDRPGRMRS